MAVTIIDPLKGRTVGPDSWQPTAREHASVPYKARTERLKATTSLTDEYGRDPFLMADFRNFLAVIWSFLGLPEPSPVQLSLAWFLQHGPDRAVILGFRGFAKSWITGAFALWTIYCDPQKKVLVVSASLNRAVQTVQWVLALTREMPELAFLEPRMEQRSSVTQGFDVAPARPDQSPSVRGVGITSQMTGSRSHLIVPDDVEIPSNSMTTLMREKIAEAVKEFDAILHPDGKIKFLGTPQVDDSLYVKLPKRGYTTRIWPARYPDKKMRNKYGDRLSPFIANRITKDPTLVGHSVWPERFPDDDLARRELSYGRSGFSLQFMLDTSLSDADRYPLKLRDLIVDHLDSERGPDVIAWGNDNALIHNDLPVMGFEGDKFYGPANRGNSYSKYNTILAAIDPSGRGGDETGMSIVGELHARLSLLFNAGWRDGYSPTTLLAIAKACVLYGVQRLLIEDDFGDGMFAALLLPVLNREWDKHNASLPQDLRGGTSIEPIRSAKAQKELRILGILEPCTQQHRLIVSTKVIEDDYNSVHSMAEDVGEEAVHHYSLIHQMTHLSRERGSLLHEDRLESLAIAVQPFAAMLGISPDESAESLAAQRVEEELEALLDEADEAVGYEKLGPAPALAWDRSATALNPK